ncbi:MAG: 50S ribosomal protein L10 [Pseudomonadota bacterium]
MKKQDKEKVVQELHERAAQARFFVLTDYRGLKVSQMSELRRGLGAAQAECQVVKNTLLRRAAQGLELESLSKDFTGPCALVMAYGDPVEPAKVLVKFAETNKAFEVRLGLLRGRRVNAEGIKALSKLPPRNVLLAQVLSTMNAVPQGFVRALADVPRRMVNVLAAIRDQKEAA